MGLGLGLGLNLGLRLGLDLDMQALEEYSSPIWRKIYSSRGLYIPRGIVLEEYVFLFEINGILISEFILVLAVDLEEEYIFLGTAKTRPSLMPSPWYVIIFDPLSPYWNYDCPATEPQRLPLRTWLLV